MKDLNELSKLVADMVCKSLLQIIGENINSSAIVENCQTDEDFKEDLFGKLKQAFPSEFSGGSDEDSVVNYIKGLYTNSELVSLLEKAEVYDDLKQDIFDNMDSDDIPENLSDEIYNKALEDVRDKIDYLEK